MALQAQKEAKIEQRISCYGGVSLVGPLPPKPTPPRVDEDEGDYLAQALRVMFPGGIPQDL